MIDKTNIIRGLEFFLNTELRSTKAFAMIIKIPISAKKINLSFIKAPILKSKFDEIENIMIKYKNPK